MDTINMHAAKTHLSKLVQRAARGETIVIASAGRPLAKLVPLDEALPRRRMGFLSGTAPVPDDFDTMGADEIAAMFGGDR